MGILFTSKGIGFTINDHWGINGDGDLILRITDNCSVGMGSGSLILNSNWKTDDKQSEEDDEPFLNRR